MAKLKTTHASGDSWQAGVTTDIDKLNGIAERLNEHTHGGTDTEKITGFTVEARTFNDQSPSVDATALTVTITGGTFTNFVHLQGTMIKNLDGSGNGEVEIDINPNGGGVVVLWGATPRSWGNGAEAYFTWFADLDTDDTTKMDFANDTVVRVRHNGTGDDVSTEVSGN